MRLNRTVVVLALVVASACSSNEDSNTTQHGSDAGTQADAGASAEVAEHLQTFNDAFTAKRSECQPFFHSLQDFVTEKSKANLESGAVAGRLVFHPEAVAACIQQLSTMSCAEFLALGWYAGCAEAMFEPRVASGSECYEGFECVGGWCDQRSSCPGRCVAFVGEGESCAAGLCGHGLYCGPGQLCVARKQSGAACWEHTECGEGLICDSMTESTPPVEGKCVSKDGRPEGSPCRPMECEQGLKCLGDVLDGVLGGTCAAVPAPKVGDACNWDKGCGSILVCAGFDFLQEEVDGHCAPWSDLGEPCTVLPSGLTGCKWGLRCVEGLCAELPSTGPCWEELGGGCASPNVCDGKDQCVPLKALGETCTNSFDCADGRCVGGKCVAHCLAP